MVLSKLAYHSTSLSMEIYFSFIEIKLVQALNVSKDFRKWILDFTNVRQAFWTIIWITKLNYFDEYFVLWKIRIDNYYFSFLLIYIYIFDSECCSLLQITILKLNCTTCRIVQPTSSHVDIDDYLIQNTKKKGIGGVLSNSFYARKLKEENNKIKKH